MRRVLGGIIGIAVLIAEPALAANVWTGCYVGGNAGWIGSRGSATLSPTGAYLTPAGFFAPPNAFGTGALPGDLAAVNNSASGFSSGFAGGGELGCNWQISHLVLGVEADFDGTTLNNQAGSASFGPVTSANPAFTVAPHSDSVSERMDWYSTVRGRIGYEGRLLDDRWLAYFTGGFAVARFTSSTDVAFQTAALPVYANVVQSGSGAATRGGGVVGGGVEYLLPSHWSVKVEYLFFAFPGFSYVSPLVAPAGVAPGYAWNTKLGTEYVSTVRVGFNYKFGWPWAYIAR
jgi:outer membrane immunogenic protein